MTLFEECVIALGHNLSILSYDESRKILKHISDVFPIASWGQIDWSKAKNVKKISSISEIKNILQINNGTPKEVYILWDNASLPVISTDINNILKVIDDVTAVSFDTWIYNPTDESIIEFYHEGEIHIGWAPKN